MTALSYGGRWYNYYSYCTLVLWGSISLSIGKRRAAAYGASLHRHNALNTPSPRTADLGLGPTASDNKALPNHVQAGRGQALGLNEEEWAIVVVGGGPGGVRSQEDSGRRGQVLRLPADHGRRGRDAGALSLPPV